MWQYLPLLENVCEVVGHKILNICCKQKKAPVLTSISGHVSHPSHLLSQRSPYISPPDVRFEQMVSFTVNTIFSISMLCIWPIQCCASVLNQISTMLWTMCDPRHLSLPMAEAHVKQLTRVCVHTNTHNTHRQIHVTNTHQHHTRKMFHTSPQIQFHY